LNENENDKTKIIGVQRINNVFHIVDKVENVFVSTHIFNLIDNVEYVVYALYSRIYKWHFCNLEKKLFVKNGIFVGDRLLRAGKKNG
jgi:hypothetical protein